MPTEPLAVTSPEINRLLGKALLTPAGVTPSEILQIAEAVVFHTLRTDKNSFLLRTSSDGRRPARR